MAISKVANSSGLQTKASTSALSASLPSNPAQGDLLLAYIWGWNGSGNLTLAAGAVVDNHGNSFAVGALETTGSGGALAIFYLVVPQAYTGTYTVTVTPGGSGGAYLALDVEEYAGTGNSPLDQSLGASSGGASATSASTGSTPTTAATCEMWTALVMIEDRATTADNLSTTTGYTERAVNNNGSGNIYPGQAEDEIAATGLSGVAASASWTWTTAAPWAAAIATWVPGTYTPPPPVAATTRMSLTGVGLA